MRSAPNPGEVYDASVSKSVISTITDSVVAQMSEWSSRPLQPIYVAVFVDAIHVKVRDGQVANRPFYAAIGVDLAGRRDVLGLWAGTPGEGESSKYWVSILTEPGEPRHHGHLLPGVRRVEGNAQLGERGISRHHRPNVCGSPDPQYVPLFLEAVLG